MRRNVAGRPGVPGCRHRAVQGCGDDHGAHPARPRPRGRRRRRAGRLLVVGFDARAPATDHDDHDDPPAAAGRGRLCRPAPRLARLRRGAVRDAPGAARLHRAEGAHAGSRGGALVDRRRRATDRQPADESRGTGGVGHRPRRVRLRAAAQGDHPPLRRRQLGSAGIRTQQPRRLRREPRRRGSPRTPHRTPRPSSRRSNRRPGTSWTPASDAAATSSATSRPSTPCRTSTSCAPRSATTSSPTWASRTAPTSARCTPSASPNARALVLDGALDPALPVDDTAIQQAQGFDTSLARFITWCHAHASCAFHGGGDVRGAYDALVARSRRVAQRAGLRLLRSDAVRHRGRGRPLRRSGRVPVARERAPRLRAG